MFFPGLMTGNQQSVSEKPENWFMKALSSVGSSKSRSGIYVTPERAMGFIAVYACVKLLSESVAQLPCNLYRRLDNKGNREKATDHALYDKLRYAPNGWMTAFDYHEYAQGGLGLRGNAYSFVERKSNGEISEIIPMNPSRVTVRVGSDRRPVYDLLDESETDVPFSKIHHVAAFKTNAYVGMSPIQAGREGLGLAIATDEHAGTVFSNGTHISGVLERPFESGMRPLGEEQVTELKNQWKKLYTGLSNAGEVAVLQDGLKFKSITMNNTDAELLASRTFGINEVARLYNVPPHMIQLLDKATFNNIEVMALQYVMYSLMPWVRRHEAAQMRDLLTEEERKDYYIEFNVSGLLRGDMKTRFEAYARGRQWGWLSVNDIRRMENLPPVANGDVYLQPLNMVESGSVIDKTVRQEINQIQSEKEDDHTD